MAKGQRLFCCPVSLVIGTFLSFIFLFLVVLIVLFGDFIGFYDIHSKLPPAIKNHPIIEKYIDMVEEEQMSYSDRMKLLIQKQQEEYKKQMEQLKQEEFKYLEKQSKLAEKEKILDDKIKAIELEEERVKKDKEVFDKQRKKYLSEEDRIKKFSKISIRMTPQKAAAYLKTIDESIMLKIFLNMQDKKAAAIMDFLEPDVLKKLLEYKLEQSNKKKVKENE